VSRRRLAALLAGCAVLAAGAAAADTMHLYSYDPADPATVRAAGPLTFTFKKGLLHTTLLNLRSTVAPATAYLRLVDVRALGRGGFPADAEAVGVYRAERNLYEVEPDAEGAALISAFCPGAGRAWMAFGPMRLNRDLTVLVLGAPAAGGQARLCRTLRFNFHGEWLLPAGRSIDPALLERPRTPLG